MAAPSPAPAMLSEQPTVTPLCLLEPQLAGTKGLAAGSRVNTQGGPAPAMKILSSADTGHSVKGLVLQGKHQGWVWFLMITRGVRLEVLGRP